MVTRRKPGRRPTAGLAPAGERGEHWWPVAKARRPSWPVVIPG